MPETLYNNIELPKVWPPRDLDPLDFQPMPVPYLSRPPKVINIDIGRQLFVDDFLIEGTTMAPEYHHPVKYPCNPVFWPETEQELDPKLPPCTLPKCGGIWYDPADRLFKMWYMAGYTGSIAYARSTDGIHWERPELDVVPGTNLVMPENFRGDSGSVWLDHDTQDESQRFKFFVRGPGGDAPGKMFTSPDGIHWSDQHETGIMGDRSTVFYNPFRRKWVQSIREVLPSRRGRCRRYMESDDFFQSGVWQPGEPPYWTGADLMDRAQYSDAQLYTLDAVAYESIMLGMFQILQGPPNNIGQEKIEPKLTELSAGYSRDGFHFLRPDRTSFIGARRTPDSWEFGYIEATAGITLIVGDELWFYYSAYAGAPEHRKGMYGNGAVGLAKLRRDGMASRRGTFPGAFLLTRPILFTHGTGLFVNANTSGSLLTAECLDESDQPIPGFTKAECLGFRGNSTCAEIRWKNAGFASLANRPIKIRFAMPRGDFYSFWAGKDAGGASGGYVAAGGPAYSSNRDL